jgi:hypothetical protein
MATFAWAMMYLSSSQADLELRFSWIQNSDFIDQHTFLHTTVRALDEPVLVDARKAGKRRNQSDVRTFRRFDRADTAVVRRMYVAHFEAGALTG